MWTYVALGDCSGVGVGARDGSYVTRIFERVRTRLPAATLHNLSRTQATTLDVIHEQLPAVAELEPDLVTVMVGLHDVARRVDPARFFERHLQLCSTLRASTDAAMVLINLPNPALSSLAPRVLRPFLLRTMREFNDQIAKVGNIIGADVVDIFARSSAGDFYCWDFFHPSDRGHAIIAEQAAAPIDAMLDGRLGRRAA